MKTVIDMHGQKVQVPQNTPCYPGIDGGLPRLYTPIEMQKINDDSAIKEAKWLAEVPERKRQEIYNKRTASLVEGGYGTIPEQLDMLYHDGLTAWKSHISKIKLNYKLEKGE
jgi:hypothetical protein